MKLVTPVYGTVAVQVSADDVVPVRGFIQRDIIEITADHYQFSVKPNLPPGAPPTAMQILPFQSGTTTFGEIKVPIVQLAITPNGYVITAQTTEIADPAMDDFMALLDNTLGFRNASAKQRRVYQSNIVVQFEVGIEEKTEIIGKIESILNHQINRPSAPFKVKRLTFGYGDVLSPTEMVLSIEAIHNSDFQIERRVTEPYSENRYFCSAPVRTSDHVRILEMIEQALK